MSDLYEQIWRGDILRWRDDTLAMWKTQYRFWERAKAQGAPQALLDALSSVSENYRQAYERLNELAPCFPEETRTALR